MYGVVRWFVRSLARRLKDALVQGREASEQFPRDTHVNGRGSVLAEDLRKQAGADKRSVVYSSRLLPTTHLCFLSFSDTFHVTITHGLVLPWFSNKSGSERVRCVRVAF
ncbi:unnamed protein product [Scytosiphon promiscuus]